MALTEQVARDALDVYIRAWVEQDPDLITTIFAADASYHERVLEAPILGREGIRAYWQSKVVESQANIKCQLLHLYLDGDTAIAEWEAEFDDRAQNVRKRMREVAILVFGGAGSHDHGPLIKSLREYWSSQEVAELTQAPSKCMPSTPT